MFGYQCINLRRMVNAEQILEKIINSIYNEMPVVTSKICAANGPWHEDSDEGCNG